MALLDCATGMRSQRCDEERASRLSGEAPRRAQYIKTTRDPRRSQYMKPGKPFYQPTPVKKGAPFKYKSPHKKVIRPVTPKRGLNVPFGPKSNAVPGPFGGTLPKAIPAKGLGGLTGLGRKLLRRSLPFPVRFVLGFLEPIPWNGAPGVEWYDFPAAGFSLRCRADPAGGPIYDLDIAYSGHDTRSVEGNSNPNLPCTTLSQVADDNLENGAGVIAAATRWMAVGPDNHGPVVRMQLREQWTRPALPAYPDIPAKWPTGVPKRWGIPYPYDTPFFPAIDPFSLPVAQPAPAPEPVPFIVIPERIHNPDRDRHEQPSGEQPSKPAAKPDPKPGVLIPNV